MKNPILQQKYNEGYQTGYINGAEYGKRVGIQAMVKRIESLRDTKGIGDKTYKKIIDVIGG